MSYLSHPLLARPARRASKGGNRLTLGLHRCTSARVYECTSARVYGRAGQSQVPNFPTRPLISPAAAKYRAERGGQVRGRQACFGLAQVHGCAGARVYECTGVRARRTVSSSHFQLAHLPSPAVAKYRAGRAAEEEQAYLEFAQRSSDAGSSFIHLSHLLVYSVYPFIRYPFTHF